MKAKDFVIKNFSPIEKLDQEYLENKLIEFAKYHTKKALEKASERAFATYDHVFLANVDKNSIINAYPEENII